MPSKRNKRVVHELQFNVSQLLKEPTGATRQYEINTVVLDKLDDGVEFASPIVGSVRFLRTGADILVTGSLTGTGQKECGRCLKPFSAPLTIELEEQFYPTIDITTGSLLPAPPDADDANQITSQHTLDLFEVVRQGLRYCQANCQGLCPICGQDRNRIDCDCEEHQVDQRWAGLQAMRLED